jgi:hypothetical protein
VSLSEADAVVNEEALDEVYVVVGKTAVEDDRSTTSLVLASTASTRTDEAFFEVEAALEVVVGFAEVVVFFVVLVVLTVVDVVFTEALLVVVAFVDVVLTDNFTVVVTFDELLTFDEVLTLLEVEVVLAVVLTLLVVVLQVVATVLPEIKALRIFFIHLEYSFPHSTLFCDAVLSQSMIPPKFEPPTNCCVSCWTSVGLR